MLLSPQLDALSKIADIIAVHSQEQEMLVEILDVLETKLHLQRRDHHAAYHQHAGTGG